MAVPKKRTSSSKTKSRHATWVNKAIIQRERAISLAKSVLNENSGSFIYSNNKNDSYTKNDTSYKWINNFLLPVFFASELY